MPAAAGARTAAPGAGAAGAEAGEAAAGPGVVLDVEVVRACWFEVFADGRRIYVGVLEAGDRATWTAEERLQVRYGRPEGVRVTLNGTYLGVPGTGVIERVYTPEGVLLVENM